MNKEKEYWVDENLNRWNSRRFTKKQAIMYSASLIDCDSCQDCAYCRACTDCKGCKDCRKCITCQDCETCQDCQGCTDCRACADCENCITCRYCEVGTSCILCRYCYDCTDCINCKGINDSFDYLCTPMSYTTRRIGSCNDNTNFYYGDTGSGKSLQVVSGCFRGNLEEFERAVKEKHGYKEYAQQYMTEIQKVKLLFDLENINTNKEENRL